MSYYTHRTPASGGFLSGFDLGKKSIFLFVVVVAIAVSVVLNALIKHSGGYLLHEKVYFRT